MENLFKNHKLLFTIHQYGHGMPCPWHPPAPAILPIMQNKPNPRTAGVSPASPSRIAQNQPNLNKAKGTLTLCA